MTLESFATSRAFTLGVELELQLVNRHDFDLVGGAADVLRDVDRRKLDLDIKPEITMSMIELATGICQKYEDVLNQLTVCRDTLLKSADLLDIGICGGGTHPFQRWGERKISNSPRFILLSKLYGYLAKEFTIFGQHVHIGCDSADDALYLLHGLSRFVPHFIALSAASPFVQGEDTGFESARLNSVFAFPMSGRAPFVQTWDEFGRYFEKMTTTGVVKSMKDFYWDIRPKPEFGTIEVRVMDTPLTVRRAAQIAAYIQSVARYILLERPFKIHEDDYLVYTYNRFQACRFGYSGTYVDPNSYSQRTVYEELMRTFELIESHAQALGAGFACCDLHNDVLLSRNDATVVREAWKRTRSLHEVVQLNCDKWRA